MASITDRGVLHETDAEVITSRVPVDLHKPDKLKLVWENIIVMSFQHLGALFGLYLAFTSAKLVTIIYTGALELVVISVNIEPKFLFLNDFFIISFACVAFLMYQISALGITAGAHRLWCHKSYKAKWPLTLMLVIFNTIAFQYNIIHWARDHRVHHKYVETDADPQDARRGFFFAHVGWLFRRKHPEVKNKGKGVDMSDLYADPILRFQQKYYLILMPILAYIIPTCIPIYFWGESIKNAVFMNLLRYVFILNSTFFINSAAHMFGSKPYDRFIDATENKTVAILMLGEGWHNYHHTFPWDYKAAELGKYELNLTCLFIDLMAKIGWAYDLKTVSKEMIMKRVKKTGDGSHELWGWGDVDQSEDEKREAIIINKRR